MKHSKLPSDAFEFYFSLGGDRSYATVAKRYSVARKTVNRHAIAHRWQERIAERERKAREAADRKSVEGLEEMQERHLKLAKAIQARGIEVLRSAPLRSAFEAIRAIDVGVRQERELRGNPRENEERAERLDEIRRLFRVAVESGLFSGAIILEQSALASGDNPADQ